MIVVDASIICAIYLQEADAELYLDLLSRNRGEAVVAPTSYWEATTRARTWRGEDGVSIARHLMQRLQIAVIPTDETQTSAAVDARRRFGRGKRGLNMGDCFSYALAVSLNAPLLFQGKDFPLTDVRSAL